MFQVEQNLVQQEENRLPDEKNSGETQNGAQPELGTPSNSPTDFVPIIGTEIHEDLPGDWLRMQQPALTASGSMWDSRS
jgi:hypothetical protein